jgi:hypothetical protein
VSNLASDCHEARILFKAPSSVCMCAMLQKYSVARRKACVEAGPENGPRGSCREEASGSVAQVYSAITCESMVTQDVELGKYESHP